MSTAKDLLIRKINKIHRLTKHGLAESRQLIDNLQQTATRASLQVSSVMEAVNIPQVYLRNQGE